ncbi:hypothetical protein BFL43_09390 [Williamsia sp. 1135]|nr:hypothetical protein BFL43_09390 [Williamsia sp. 1135]
MRQLTDEQLVWVDTDCGVDDSLAISLVLAAGKLHGISTTWGNCTAGEAARNAQWVLDLWGSSSAVVTGGPPTASWVRGDAHGSDGLGDTLTDARQPPSASSAQPAAEAIIDFAKRTAGRGALLAIAPLTNLALALEMEPRITEWIGDVIVMGGHGFGEPSDWLSAAGDTNTRHNPRASTAVAHSDLRTTWVGLDVTRTVVLDDTDFGTGEASQALRAVHESYGRSRAASYGYGPQWGVPAHDSVAACVALRHTNMSSRPALVDVDAGVVRLHPAKTGAASRHRGVAHVDRNAIRATIRRNLI